MTQDPDDTASDEPRDRNAPGDSERAAGGGRKLDEDAAWRAIVEHFGERARLDEEPPQPEPTEPTEPTQPTQATRPPADGPPADVVERWEDQDHFVPPEPPPVPTMAPRRRAAWLGLFGSPLVMLAAVVLGWKPWDWVLGALVICFVGGFVYLVATMPRHRPDDWSGDDGAVV